MKILHITGFYNREVSYQENLIPLGEKKLGNKVYILTSDLNPKYDVSNKYTAGVERHHLPIIRIKTRFSIKGIPVMYIPLSLIKRINPDVIFMHDVNPYTIQIVLMHHFGLLGGAKLFWDCHSEVGKDNKNFLIRRYNTLFRYFFRVFGAKIKIYYGVAPECCAFIKEVYGIPDDKIKLLPLPSVKNVLSEQEIVSVKNKFGISKEKKILLHSGKLPGNKRTSLVIKAFERLPEETFELLVTGSLEQSFSDDNKTFFARENVNYLGWLDPSELRNVISACDILIQPGSLSNTFIDALCSGTPIILADTAQGRFLTSNNNGDLVSKNCCDLNLFDSIMRVISQLSQYKKNAAVVANKFDYLEIAKGTTNDYIS